MLKPLSAESVVSSGGKAPASLVMAGRVFRAMHGYYGGIFASKWSNGSIDDNGDDLGVVEAMRVWAYELRRYDERVVLDAISRCKTAHPEFPPSLPQFDALCRACMPVKPFRAALPMSPELHAERSRVARERLRDLRARLVPAKPEQPEQSEHPLQPLFGAICDAVATAGGDEVACIRRFDRIIGGVA